MRVLETQSCRDPSTADAVCHILDELYLNTRSGSNRRMKSRMNLSQLHESFFYREISIYNASTQTAKQSMQDTYRRQKVRRVYVSPVAPAF